MVSLEKYDLPAVRQKHSPLLRFWKQLGQGYAAEGGIGKAVGLGQLPAQGLPWLPLHGRLGHLMQPEA